MYTSKATLLVAVTALATACAQSPSAPSTTTTGLVLSQQSATVGRNTTQGLIATAQLSTGAATDVTLSATWSSSNETVATVSAGVVTVRALGTAQISASYQGKIATATITARRRTDFDGRLTARDASGEASISGVGMFLDSAMVATKGNSGYLPQSWITARGSDPQRPSIDPGMHDVRFQVDLKTGAHEVIASATTLSVYDADTGELLTSIPLLQKRAVSVDNGDHGESVMTWTIDVPTFTQ